MAPFRTDREFEALQRAIRGDSYQALLAEVIGSQRFLHDLHTWADVTTFMRRGDSRDPSKSALLRLIIEAHAEDRDPRWRAILLAIFWPGLKSIARKKRHWLPDERERWLDTVWAFLDVILRLNPACGTDRYVQRIYNATVHRLYLHYQAAWKVRSREVSLEPDEFDRLQGPSGDEVLAVLELREWQERELARLQRHLTAGRIGKGDFHLLVGTRIYGESLADYAAARKLRYQTVKKRRLRAEATMRRHEADRDEV